MTGQDSDPFAAIGATPALAPALADAGRIALASALRYGQSLMAVQMRYQAAILAAMTDQAKGTATPESREAADEFRAYLREIGETACREARRLQLELDQLGERLARDAAPAAGTAIRPYRVKD